ncbi:MAG: hydrogenase expression/formation protein HypE [bacterium (Candidatus Ratteibacteria) CG_4_9_14_3_um_filter_41_21]|uniref:Hydrogenase expression/formation protein HypE n=2 Tax=Candidatus Ratteibacteria TaxID=2979319 RepID=A0A2M7YGD2_9BACT|nr:MAG: hydrogenase expression/formation protein HypE [bacterium (Candidatus Ratteibacteria) CG15_BIG_FIL_POST_REV_8_21_14_020_41_12]PJA62033.1 MAG: hydrogenase expression/formation protein HypE [bacterium (Candidatus Ratteibacteria) CG_4_9_14_3_um_filter_41_21]HCG76777.1 hydrogenase expression/formation protein HypE [bacterium]
MKKNSGSQRISLAHGGGGKLMHRLIKELFQEKFANEILNELSDSAVVEFLPKNNSSLCFTTDSYVVNPLFFPGGDIGKLAICGTINDLAVVGAKPRYISCALIIEEGLEYEVLKRITESMAKIARDEDVKIVTGDTKVVEKGNLDKLFINTAGLGLRKKINLSKETIIPGDKIIVNGSIGEHGLAILAARGEFNFQAKISSDCAPLTNLIQRIINLRRSAALCGIKFMRDPTRGGLAATLNEIAGGMNFGILINEKDIPVKKEVRAACELLGFDPLYIANEGKVVVIVSGKDAEVVLKAMRQDPLGKESRIIGEVTKAPGGKVIMKTKIRGSRIIDMLVGDQLPRIC